MDYKDLYPKLDKVLKSNFARPYAMGNKDTNRECAPEREGGLMVHGSWLMVNGPLLIHDPHVVSG